MYDVTVIGAGPAGYVAALRAGQLGMKTALVERGRVGGRALYSGVLPSKGMLESARMFARTKDAALFGIEGVDTSALRFNPTTARRHVETAAARMGANIERRLKNAGVDILKGEAEIVSGTSVSVAGRLIESRHIILATGSNTRELPFDMPSDRSETAWTALSRSEVPTHVVVLGGSPIALEYTQLFSMLGCEVTLATSQPRLLPMLGPRLEEAVSQRLLSAGVTIITNAAKYSYENGRLMIDRDGAQCDLLVNCFSEYPVLPAMRVDPTMNGAFPRVDEYLRTSVQSIYAVGNVNGLMPSARSASAQGLYAVNHIAGVPQPWHQRGEPIVVYGEPELAQVGRTEETLEDDGVRYRSVEAPLSQNGKALLTGDEDGFVRILFGPEYGEVFGVQIFAENASDLIGEAGALMQFEGTVYDVGRTAHAHPTISEVFMELGQLAGEEMR